MACAPKIFMSTKIIESDPLFHKTTYRHGLCCLLSILCFSSLSPLVLSYLAKDPSVAAYRKIA